MLRTALPFYTYYYNYNYIKTKLCENRNKPLLLCNGSCYVRNELKENNLLIEKGAENATLAIVPVVDLYIPIFFYTSTFIFKEVNTFKGIDLPTYFKLLKPIDVVASIFHPPQLF